MAWADVMQASQTGPENEGLRGHCISKKTNPERMEILTRGIMLAENSIKLCRLPHTLCRFAELHNYWAILCLPRTYLPEMDIRPKTGQTAFLSCLTFHGGDMLHRHMSRFKRQSATTFPTVDGENELEFLSTQPF